MIAFSILFFHASFHVFFHAWLTRSACSKVINLSTTVHLANMLIRTACALVDQKMVIIAMIERCMRMFNFAFLAVVLHDVIVDLVVWFDRVRPEKCWSHES